MSTAKTPKPQAGPHDGRQQNPTADKGERVKGQEEDFDPQRTDPRDRPETYANQPASGKPAARPSGKDGK